MTKEVFWCQSSYGNTTRFNFFYTHNNFLVTAPGTIGRVNQEIFRYDQRPLYMIRSDSRILIFVKSLMGTKLDSIFFTHKIDQKVASYWLVSVTTHYNCIKWQYIRCLKVYRITMGITINLNRISVISNLLDDERTSLIFRVKL